MIHFKRFDLLLCLAHQTLQTQITESNFNAGGSFVPAEMAEQFLIAVEYQMGLVSHLLVQSW